MRISPKDFFKLPMKRATISPIIQALKSADGQDGQIRASIFFGKEKKRYALSLGSGIKRIFEINKRRNKHHHHQSGAPLGRFHLIEERNPNGNKYLYTYNDDDRFRKVKAVNKDGSLSCRINMRR